MGWATAGAAAAVRRRRAEEETVKYLIEDPAAGTLYKRGQLLGQGAFGHCYKFTDISTNRVYAVKVVSQLRISKLGSQRKEPPKKLPDAVCRTSPSCSIVFPFGDPDRPHMGQPRARSCTQPLFGLHQKRQSVKIPGRDSSTLCCPGEMRGDWKKRKCQMSQSGST